MTRTEAAAAAAPDEDRALVAAFRAGDRRAFETLVRRHQRPVWAIALRFAGDRDVAEDLAQRAFVTALERIAELRGSFRPWLLRIVVNLSKNHRRDDGRLVRGADVEPVTEHGADQALDEARRARAIREAIAKLPERQREVAMLRVDGQLPFAEIGQALGITENNAKVNYHHAVKKLRELLGGADAGL